MLKTFQKTFQVFFLLSSFASTMAMDDEKSLLSKTSFTPLRLVDTSSFYPPVPFENPVIFHIPIIETVDNTIKSEIIKAIVDRKPEDLSFTLPTKIGEVGAVIELNAPVFLTLGNSIFFRPTMVIDHVLPWSAQIENDQVTLHFISPYDLRLNVIFPLPDDLTDFVFIDPTSKKPPFYTPSLSQTSLSFISKDQPIRVAGRRFVKPLQKIALSSVIQHFNEEKLSIEQLSSLPQDLKDSLHQILRKT